MRTKNILKICALSAVMALATSCQEESLACRESIFPDTESTTPDKFDQWLKRNFTDPYNIKVTYRYVDAETSQAYNVVPADSSRSVVLAKLLKHTWIDVYKEVAGDDFVKKYCPRIYQFIGSAKYNSSGTIVKGEAEGGLKISLFRINDIDRNNLVIDIDNPNATESSSDAIEMNQYFLKVMHHEFCHILTQTKNYNTEFATITNSTYNPNGWNNTTFEEVAPLGYVTPYASSESNEDFADTYSVYVSRTDEAWQKLLDAARKPKVDADGNSMYAEDANGKPVYELDEDGNKIYDTDADNHLVPVTDDNGNIVYDTDANGNPLYLTYNGAKVKMTTANTNKNYYAFDSTGRIQVYYISTSSGKAYSCGANQNGGSPIYQTDADGNTVYDKDGNPVNAYFRLPKFECKRKLAYDTSGVDLLNRKVEIIREYMQNSWGFDIDEIRHKVVEKIQSVNEIDFDNLDD